VNGPTPIITETPPLARWDAANSRFEVMPAPSVKVEQGEYLRMYGSIFADARAVYLPCKNSVWRFDTIKRAWQEFKAPPSIPYTAFLGGLCPTSDGTFWKNGYSDFIHWSPPGTKPNASDAPGGQPTSAR